MLLSELLSYLDMPMTIRVGKIYKETIVENIVRMNEEPYIHLTTMNIGKLSELKKNQNCNLFGIFLLIRDCDISYACFSNEKAIMIEIPDTDIEALQKKLKNILLYNVSINDKTDEFLSKMLTATNLAGLLSTMSNFFRTKLVVASPGGRKIYAASEYDVEKKHSVKIDPGQISFTIEAHAKSISGNYGKDFDNNNPYAIYIPDTHEWVLRSKVYYGSNYLGYLVAYTDNFAHASRISVRLFKLLSEMVAHMIEVNSAKTSWQYNREKGYLEMFLGDILEGATDETHISIVGKHELFSYNSEKRMISIPIKDYLYVNKNDGYLIEKIRGCFPYSISFYYKRDVIVLLNEGRDGNNLVRKKEDIEEFLKSNHLQAFCSDIFTEIYQMPFYYEQVKKVEKLLGKLRKEGVIFWYDEFKFYDMAENSCKDSEESLKKYCSAVLLQILDDDKKNGTDFYTLLKTYIISNKSMMECSENLFIHKSTVAYRINKIKKQYNLNLDDFDKIVELYNSFKLLELIGI